MYGVDVTMSAAAHGGRKRELHLQTEFTCGLKLPDLGTKLGASANLSLLNHLPSPMGIWFYIYNHFTCMCLKFVQGLGKELSG